MQSFPFPSRTELLGCYSDQDFLAKLHCVRQAFQVRTAQGSWVPVLHVLLCQHRGELFASLEQVKAEAAAAQAPLV